MSGGFELHWVDFIQGGVGYVVGNSIAEKEMAQSSNWALWVAVVVLVVMVYESIRGHLGGVLVDERATSEIGEILRNTFGSVRSILVWLLLHTFRILVMWLFEMQDTFLAFVTLIIVVVTVFSAMEKLGWGRNNATPIVSVHQSQSQGEMGLKPPPADITDDA